MATTADMSTSRLEELLGDDAQSLLQHQSQTVTKDNLHLPGPDFIDRVFVDSDRPTTVLRNFLLLFNCVRLVGTC